MNFIPIFKQNPVFCYSLNLYLRAQELYLKYFSVSINSKMRAFRMEDIEVSYISILV